MSYWSHNPELLDEITTKFLPEPWKAQVEEDEIELSDVPDDILFKAMREGEADYWGSMADEAVMRAKDIKMEEALSDVGQEEERDLKRESDFVPI